MCKLFDRIFQLPFKRWFAKENKKQSELVIPLDSENMRMLEDALTKYFEENNNE